MKNLIKRLALVMVLSFFAISGIFCEEMFGAKNTVGFKVSLPAGMEYSRNISEHFALGVIYGGTIDYSKASNSESRISSFFDLGITGKYVFSESINRKGNGFQGYAFANFCAVGAFLGSSKNWFLDLMYSGFGIGLEYYVTPHFSFPLELGFGSFLSDTVLFSPMAGTGFRIHF